MTVLPLIVDISYLVFRLFYGYNTLINTRKIRSYNNILLFIYKWIIILKNKKKEFLKFLLENRIKLYLILLVTVSFLLLRRFMYFVFRFTKYLAELCLTLTHRQYQHLFYFFFKII